MAERAIFNRPHYGNKISTVETSGRRKWIYAFQPKGKLYRYRTYVAWFYLAIFFLMPFIKVNGNPLFLFNIPDRQFILFGQLFLPQDFMILGVAMLVGILFIVVFTLLFGRVFCGWVCPQTIFLEMVFRKIEYLIEGPAHKQWANKKKKVKPKGYYLRKVIKQMVFVLVSFLFANTFLTYIIGVDGLFQVIREPLKDHIFGFAGILIFTGAFYAVFAHVREIVCTVICPYGRLQSVLMDKQSVAVAYNYNRGEPRSKKRKDQEAGDCIDCGMCVNVCPTGIDIRDGLQMECVNCTACIDACDDMMRKVGKPERLITFASEEQLETNTVGKYKWNYRSRAYLAVLIAMVLLLTSMLVNRSVFDATVLRVPGQLYQESTNGTLTNLYKIGVVNKGAKTLAFDLAVKEPGAQIEYVGKKVDSLKTGVHTEQMFFIRVKEDQLHGRRNDFHVEVKSGDRVIQTKKVSFTGKY